MLAFCRLEERKGKERDKNKIWGMEDFQRENILDLRSYTTKFPYLVQG